MHLSMRLCRLMFALLFVALPARAQVVETPVAFDSAGRVMAVTPALAERLQLTAPAWPVSGEFRDARLFSVQPAGGFVLAVQRPTGAVERLALNDAQRAALRSAIDAAMIATGRPTAEAGSEAISEPAGAAFARRQTLLAATIYGPIAASLADDGSAAGALYLLVTGGTFFTTYGISQSQTVTRAQNHLAGHLGVMYGGAGALYTHALIGDSDEGRATRGIGLASAVVGSIAGFNIGRRMSDAEAHAITAGVEAGGLLSLAAAGLTTGSDKAASAAVATGILAGGPIGLQYPRTASYTVTAGDVDAVGTAGLVGGILGAALLPESADRVPVAAVLGGSYAAGLFFGDRLIARNYDLTQSESNLAGVGAVAGGLIGLAIPTLAGSDDPHFLFGAAGVGATLGFASIIGMSSHYVGPVSKASRQSRFRADFSPAGLFGALSRAPGRHSLVRLSF